MRPAMPNPAAGPLDPAIPFLSGAAALTAATALLREFGDDAAMAAQLRAAQSRARDNLITFCHWREVERMLDWLSAPVQGATRH